MRSHALMCGCIEQPVHEGMAIMHRCDTMCNPTNCTPQLPHTYHDISGYRYTAHVDKLLVDRQV